MKNNKVKQLYIDKEFGKIACLLGNDTHKVIITKDSSIQPVGYKDLSGINNLVDNTEKQSSSEKNSNFSSIKYSPLFNRVVKGN
jgi:hypothetical protein